MEDCQAPVDIKNCADETGNNARDSFPSLAAQNSRPLSALLLLGSKNWTLFFKYDFYLSVIFDFKAILFTGIFLCPFLNQ